MHGLDQSEALTEAAQELSRARRAVESIKLLSGSTDAEAALHWQARLAEAKDVRTAARARYDAAYKVYTNPHNVEKTFS